MKGYSSIVKGYPQGIYFRDGILHIGDPDSPNTPRGLHIENVLEIDNLQNGANGNICLLNPEADVLVKEDYSERNTHEIQLVRKVEDCIYEDEWGIRYRITNALNPRVSIDGSALEDKESITEHPFFHRDTILRDMNEYTTYSIHEVAKNGFKDYTNLNFSELPDTIEIIHSNAFANCTSLNSAIPMPKELEKLFYYSFGGCSNLQYVSFTECSKIFVYFSDTNVFQGCSQCTVKLSSKQAWNLDAEGIIIWGEDDIPRIGDAVVIGYVL